MSRPDTPSTTRWASGNYGAGANPWNGQPKRSSPGSDGFTPNAVVPAEEVNYVIDRNASEAQTGFTTLMQWLGQVQAQNWTHVESAIGTGVGTTGPYYTQCVRWGRMDSALAGSNVQSLQGAWYATVYDNSGTPLRRLVRSFDGGNSWTVLGSMPAIAANAFNGKFAVLPNGNVIITKGSNTNVSKYTASTGNITDQLHGAAIFRPNFIEPMYDFASDGQVNGAIVLGNDGTNTKVATCNEDGGTWVDQSSHVPASLASGAGVTSPWVGAASVGLYVLFRTDAAQTKYCTLTSPSTWTERTSPVGAGESAVAVCWSDTLGGIQGKFMLVTNTATDTKVYTSTDGITWTLKSTIAGILFSGVSCCGSLFVATQLGGTDAYNHQPDGLWASVDGGVTWYRLPTYAMPHDTAGDTRTQSPAVTVARTEFGSYQLCAYNTMNVLFGLSAGWFQHT